MIEALPAAADAVAERFTDYLNKPEARVPLRTFLTDAASIPDVRGLALVVWEAEHMQPLLKLVALTNQQVYANGIHPPRDPHGQLRAAYARLDETLFSRPRPLTVRLSFLDVGEQDLTKRLKTLRQDLERPAPWDISVQPQEHIALLAAVTTPDGLG